MADTRKFSDFIKTFAAGALDDELTAALNATADAVYMKETAGTLTLKLKLNVPKGTTHGLIVSADVDAKPPKEARANFFYVGEEGELSHRDPRQPLLPGMPEPKENQNNA